jgi:hypothetical protein
MFLMMCIFNGLIIKKNIFSCVCLLIKFALNRFYFRNIKIFIYQESWKEFVAKFSNEFNEVFKRCARNFTKNLIEHYKEEESAVGDSEKVAKSTLSRDYEALYSSMDFSDVELEVEGKTLRAHKAILSSN